MGNIIVVILLIIAIIMAVVYIFKAKNNTDKCSGCPYSSSCGVNNKQSYSKKCEKNK